MKNQEIALVTGASSGFGLLTARRLAESGFRVFGTSRRPEQVEKEAGIEMLPLDVTSTDSVRACVDTVLERCGHIDLLVNNAGQMQGGLVEETSIEDACSVFDVNFWGTVRMINAVLPGMRARDVGKIVNVSSVSGLVGSPGQGFYAASKHALGGFTEALDAELGNFAIDLFLVEPGFFRTALHEGRIQASETIPDYDPIRSILESNLATSFSEGGDPEEVAQVILAIALGKKTGLHHLVGKDAKQVSRLRKWLPEGLFRRGLRRNFGLANGSR